MSASTRSKLGPALTRAEIDRAAVLVVVPGGAPPDYTWYVKPTMLSARNPQVKRSSAGKSVTNRKIA